MATAKGAAMKMDAIVLLQVSLQWISRILRLKQKQGTTMACGICLRSDVQPIIKFVSEKHPAVFTSDTNPPQPSAILCGPSSHPMLRKVWAHLRSHHIINYALGQAADLQPSFPSISTTLAYRHISTSLLSTLPESAVEILDHRTTNLCITQTDCWNFHNKYFHPPYHSHRKSRCCFCTSLGIGTILKLNDTQSPCQWHCGKKLWIKS